MGGLVIFEVSRGGGGGGGHGVMEMGVGWVESG